MDDAPEQAQNKLENNRWSRHMWRSLIHEDGSLTGQEFLHGFGIHGSRRLARSCTETERAAEEE